MNTSLNNLDSEQPFEAGTRVPSLIAQLQAATDTTRGSGTMAGADPSPRPTARIEAVDTLILIDHHAAAWVRRLGHDDPGSTIACLTRLDGLHAGIPTPHHPTSRHGDCCTRHQLEHDIRTWWHQARIITGWDTPAYRPSATCLHCGHPGTLRVSLHPLAATCVICRTTWDETTIGLLTRHIDTEHTLNHLVLTHGGAVA